MFKLMDKKIVAILSKLFLLNWPYDLFNFYGKNNVLTILKCLIICF